MHLVRSLSVAVLALAPVLAAGQGQPPPPTYAPPPTSAPSQPTFAPPAQPAPAQPSAPQGLPVPSITRVRFAGMMGLDFGFTDILKVTLTDGSTRKVVANQGFVIGVGATFLPLLGGRLETQATIGLKYTGVSASNGSATLLVFPLEILETVHVDPLRLAAGVVYLHRPKMSADGVIAAYETQFDSSLGVVLQAEWCFRRRSGDLSFGPRFILQRFKVSDTGQTIDANAFGVVLSVAVG